MNIVCLPCFSHLKMFHEFILLSPTHCVFCIAFRPEHAMYPNTQVQTAFCIKILWYNGGNKLNKQTRPFWRINHPKESLLTLAAFMLFGCWNIPLHLNCLLLPSNAMKFLLSPLTMVLNVNVIKSLTLIRYYYTVTKIVAGPKRSWVKITTWGLSAWSSPGACLGYLQAL